MSNSEKKEKSIDQIVPGDKIVAIIGGKEITATVLMIDGDMVACIMPPGKAEHALSAWTVTAQIYVKPGIKVVKDIDSYLNWKGSWLFTKDCKKYVEVNSKTDLNLNVGIPMNIGINKSSAFWDMMGEHANDAAYRIAQIQITKAIKSAIVSLLEKKGADSVRVDTLKHMLDSEVGSSLICYSAGSWFALRPIHF